MERKGGRIGEEESCWTEDRETGSRRDFIKTSEDGRI